MNTSIRSLLGIHIHQLSDIYAPEEAKEIAYRLVEYVLGCNRSKLLLELDDCASSAFRKEVASYIQRLLCNEPLQYVIGEVEFYGCLIKVTPDVLIPRPETEELVDIIVRDWSAKEIRVADFGTGSGCIPVALAKNLALSMVTSVDVSEKALQVARENAQQNGVDVNFLLDDMRSFKSEDLFDVIVSNPPYVMEVEKALMRDNVLNYEPHLALFVKDSDPLEFYKAIARITSAQLKVGGKVYLEINQQLGLETANLFADLGMKTEVRKDLFGVDRFVLAEWGGQK